MDLNFQLQYIKQLIDYDDFLAKIETIKKLHSKAILIVGMSKSGSTTVFNWLTNKRM